MGVDTTTFSAYSIKHAAMSFLVKNGASDADIELAAHYKRKNEVIGQFYAKRESLKRIHDLLAKATVPKQEPKRKIVIKIPKRAETEEEKAERLEKQRLDGLKRMEAPYDEPVKPQETSSGFCTDDEIELMKKKLFNLRDEHLMNGKREEDNVEVIIDLKKKGDNGNNGNNGNCGESATPGDNVTTGGGADLFN
jgi:hypothetical protein